MIIFYKWKYILHMFFNDKHLILKLLACKNSHLSSLLATRVVYQKRGEMAISQVIKFLTELESENDAARSGEKNEVTQRKPRKVALRTMSIRS